MNILPEFNRPIIQNNVGGGHRYKVDGFDCRACANCRKGKPCIGLPSVTGVTGKYIDGDMYGAGIRAGLDMVFGAYTDKTKTTVTDTGWMTDFLGDKNPPLDHDITRYRQEVESIPTAGELARDFGTGVHAAIEEWLKATMTGEEPFLEEQYLEPARRVVEWLDSHECEILDVEVNLYHPTMLYGGQVDCIAKRGNEILIFDWKSGRGIYNNHAAQLGAYAMAYEALTGERVAEAWVIQTRANGEFQAKKVQDLYTAKALFVNLHSTKENWENIAWEEAL